MFGKPIPPVPEVIGLCAKGELPTTKGFTFYVPICVVMGISYPTFPDFRSTVVAF